MAEPSTSGSKHKLVNPPAPSLKDFVFTEKLGSGTYATVHKAYKKSSEDREVVAIKCIKKSSLNRVSVENLLVEIEILKQIKHEHIVKLIDFQWDSSYIYLIMEYCGGGDLSKFIQARRILPEFVVRRFLQQIAAALKLLHDNGIAHLDLKPHNILLTSSDQPILKLADFGFAQHLESSSGENALRGSPLYMAPEIVLKRHYDAKVDLWSIGVILYESLFGRPPYASRSVNDLITKIKVEQPIEIPSSPQISLSCRHMLNSLLRRDPLERISFEDFFAHPFVDLEHRPSSECLTKGASIVQLAVIADGDGKIHEALKLYSDAIEYLIPAIYYENDNLKKVELRKKVREYCNRAEKLKLLAKSVTNDITTSEARQKLLLMSSNDPVVSQGLKLLQSGHDKETQKQYEEALNLYEGGIQQLLPILAERPSALRKLLHAEVDRHLLRAEALKSYILIENAKSRVDEQTSTSRKELKDEIKEDLSASSSDYRCSVQ